MKFYIATRFERAEDQKALSGVLKGLGHEISYDWSEHGSVQSEGPERIREVAQLETRGVLDADLVVVLLPGGRGTHAELGIAVADSERQRERRGLGQVGGQKRIVIVGDDGSVDGRTCAFYHHPQVDRRFATVEELVVFMQELSTAGGEWR